MKQDLVSDGGSSFRPVVIKTFSGRASKIETLTGLLEYTNVGGGGYANLIANGWAGRLCRILSFQKSDDELFRGVASRTPLTSLKRLIQILVIGSDGDHCPESTYAVAKEVGAEIASRGAVLVTGGLGGVMEAACRGAKEKGGMVVGILPHEDMSYANPYCDIIIPTGMGFSRNYVTAYSADSAIVVGGGAGTYVEALVAYQKGKPIVAVKGTGGTADKIADSYLDDRKTVKVMAAPTPKDAVDRALDHALNGKRGIRYFQSVARML